MANRPITATKLPANNRYYPLLTVNIRTTAGSFPRPAIVDSGADRTTVPAEFLIGTPITAASLAPGGTSRGVGGTAVPTRICKNEIWWEKWKVCDQFVVLAPGRMANFPIILLGREDFFMRFDVSFDWSHKPEPRFFVNKIK